MLIQWKKISSYGTISHPISFSNNSYCIAAGFSQESGSYGFRIYDLTSTNFKTVKIGSSTAQGGWYIAVGK